MLTCTEHHQSCIGRCVQLLHAQPVSQWSPSIRYCTWTRGERFFCLLATPAYNMIHTTELNEDTNARYNYINRHKNKIQTVDERWKHAEKERGTEKERKRKEKNCLMLNGGIRSFQNYTIQARYFQKDVLKLSKPKKCCILLLRSNHFILNPLLYRFNMTTIEYNLPHHHPLSLLSHGGYPPQIPLQPPSVVYQESWEPWSTGTGRASRRCGDVTPVSVYTGCLSTHTKVQMGLPSNKQHLYHSIVKMFAVFF